MSGQRVLGATLVWLVVVSSVSALVWVVISRAGDDLVASDQPLVTTPATASAPRTPTPRPSRTPSKTPPRTPSPTPSNPSPTTSSPSTAVTPTASPSTTPSSSPTSPPSTGQSSSPTEERRTWQGQPGSIVVSCGAAGIRSVFAQPANGYRAEVHREDDRIEVDFEGRDDESGIHVTVVARCVAGVPSFSTQSEQGD